MVVREWRGRVKKGKLDDYIKVLERTGLRDYASTPGNRGIWLLIDRSAEEVTLLTLWDSRAAIGAFAGEEIDKAVYYPEDDDYLMEKPERLRHYDVVSAFPVFQADQKFIS